MLSAHPPPAAPVSDLAPGQSGMDDMKLLEQRAEQLAAEAERDQPPRAQSKILFVRQARGRGSKRLLHRGGAGEAECAGPA